MGLGDSNDKVPPPERPDSGAEDIEDYGESGFGNAVREAMDRAGIDTGVYLSWRGLSVIANQVCLPPDF